MFVLAYRICLSGVVGHDGSVIDELELTTWQYMLNLIVRLINLAVD